MSNIEQIEKCKFGKFMSSEIVNPNKIEKPRFGKFTSSEVLKKYGCES